MMLLINKICKDRAQHLLLGTFLLLCGPVAFAAAVVFDSERHRFAIEVVAQKLVHPWGMAFLPNGDIMVTERRGRLYRIKPQPFNMELITGLPSIEEYGQGGLLDVALHPDYSTNNTIYLSYVDKQGQGYGTRVLRAVLDRNRIKDIRVIFSLAKNTNKTVHFGSRLLFSNDKRLLISLGDRGDRPRAQDLKDQAGSLIRLNADGTVPSDNPFFDHLTSKADKAIYTYGNRNIQGLAMHPKTGAIYMHEHGPQGGDELNIVKPGANYGWPTITYGVNYVSGTAIGIGTEKAGMEQPLHYWIPSIGASGMTFYSGDEFPGWDGDLFIGSLKFGQLVRIKLKNNKVVHEERLLHGRFGRIRDVRQGIDGALYLLTDEENGALLRISNEDRKQPPAQQNRTR